MTKDLISRVADELTAEQYSVTNPIGVRPMAADFYIWAISSVLVRTHD